jgi:segregation and condensation protein B
MTARPAIIENMLEDEMIVIDSDQGDDAPAEQMPEEASTDRPEGQGEDVPATVVTMHPMADRAESLRVIEAMLFAASEPLAIAAFAEFLPKGVNVEALIADLAENYANRGVNIVQVAGKYALRTAADLGAILRKEKTEQKRLGKAALETLAIIAYHQPVTRAEIEEVRGVAISKGTLDNLLEIGWVKMRGRRKTPGRPVTYGTTDGFLGHFGLNELTDLPGLQELKAAGLLDSSLPPGFDVPMPKLTDALTAEEEPLDGTEQMPLEMHLPDDAASAETAAGAGDDGTAEG